MSKIICSICYKNQATEIDNLYCEKCLDELITELNNTPKPNTKSKQTFHTIESEYFADNKKYRRK